MVASFAVAMHAAIAASAVMKRSFPALLHRLEKHRSRFTALFGG
jgi:hypothetical protein